ncbi:lysosomal Pro-X carboxypeptidase-like [Tripterygium wilfordii]|uniref:Lysosomal Pro-X carboxypeptidase-like n=1 Tax=Tripterygium wilfordii TaxID=458696 RepID=A0A7J7CGW5_TRIWF|nr:lysosomal Pro-X carboxypeptidase-like [Tripterygium wilfordii]
MRTITVSSTRRWVVVPYYCKLFGGLTRSHTRRLSPIFKYYIVVALLQHRYYGESIPFEVKSLGYLNSAQALADYAEILIHIKEKNNALESPIIVIGGSYGGMLASWFRLKYPHIALGALASSAPILYFDDTMRQNKITSAISQIFKEVSKTCYETIKRSWSEIDEAASTPRGLTKLSNTFQTCRELRYSSELKNFLESLYMKAAQTGQPVVKDICESIDKTPNEDGTDLNKIFAAVVAVSSDDHTHCYVNPPSALALEWQRCSEIMMPKGQGRSETLFEPAPPNQMEIMTKDCQSLYSVTPRPHWLTTYYGGHNMKLILKSFGSNIIFSNGLKDPFSHGGVLEDISTTIHAVKIEEGGHCEDIFPNDDANSQRLALVTRDEYKIIQEWITQYDTDRKSSSD